LRALLRLSCAAALVALAFPTGALAGVKTLVFTSAPIKVGAFGVERGAQLAPSQKEDGYVVGMRAEVVDLLGNPVADSDVMLHHVVFAKVGTPDATCSSVQRRIPSRFSC
jgi:hypothetical protein